MTEHFEIAIIGAGPGGLGAAANAAHHKISHILFEKAEVGNTVFEYQLRKHVMAEPGKLPLRSHVEFTPGTREAVLEKWNVGLKIKGVNNQKLEVKGIKKNGDIFEISHSAGSCTAKYVVLAIGVQGSPRKLGVPGEDLPHVSYTLRDPDAFIDKDLLVVGAGDAAVENAVALCEKNRVSILNRTEDFARAKDGNVSLINKAIDTGKIRCFYNSSTEKVEADKVYIQSASEGLVELKCDQIIARIGAILPRKFLEGCGINFPNQDISSVPLVSKKYESNVSGLYIVGALIGYPLIKQAMNQGHEVVEHILGNAIEPADQILILEKLKHLDGDLEQNLDLIRSKLSLFKDLSDPQYRELIIDSTVHVLKKGAQVFEKNDYTDTFFNVISGRAEILLDSGKKIPVQAGEFFGEIGLLSGRRRTATVEVAEDIWLLETPRKLMLKLIASVESVKKAIDLKFMNNALATSIFPDVAANVISELATKAKIRVFKKGEIIFKQGDPGEELLVIRKGSVKISLLGKSGQDVTQTYVPAGNFVGEMALLKEATTPRSATVTAAVACEMIVIGKSDFREVLSRNSEASSRITSIAKQREIENITARRDESAGSLLDFMLGHGVSDADNVLLIDSDLCVGCDNCETACAATHGGYSRLDRKGGKSFASIQLPISCRHCENPLCMIDCPPDALVRRPDGEVIIQDSCIGCGNCVSNCPYGVIKMVYPKDDSGFSLLKLFGLKSDSGKKEKGPAKAGKCDMCSQLESGPACVRSCPTGAAMRVNPSVMLKLISNKKGAI
ncbi:MAG: cyclic nucleotide-binding domain-containing protein [bacterium]|nr:cyclic nucleotide-binding domain-containing protein [bacterium]